MFRGTYFLDVLIHNNANGRQALNFVLKENHLKGQAKPLERSGRVRHLRKGKRPRFMEKTGRVTYRRNLAGGGRVRSQTWCVPTSVF